MYRTVCSYTHTHLSPVSVEVSIEVNSSALRIVKRLHILPPQSVLWVLQPSQLYRHNQGDIDMHAVRLRLT